MCMIYSLCVVRLNMCGISLLGIVGMNEYCTELLPSTFPHQQVRCYLVMPFSYYCCISILFIETLMLPSSL